MRRSPFRGSLTRTSPWLIGTILAIPLRFFDNDLRYFNIPPELLLGLWVLFALIVGDRLDAKIGKADVVAVTNTGLVQDDAKVDFTDISKIILTLGYSYKSTKLWCYIYHPNDEFEDERDGVYMDATDIVRCLTRSPLNQWYISRLHVTMSRGMNGEGLQISYGQWENTLGRKTSSMEFAYSSFWNC